VALRRPMAAPQPVSRGRAERNPRSEGASQLWELQTALLFPSLPLVTFLLWPALGVPLGASCLECAAFGGLPKWGLLCVPCFDLPRPAFRGLSAGSCWRKLSRGASPVQRERTRRACDQGTRDAPVSSALQCPPNLVGFSAVQCSAVQCRPNPGRRDPAVQSQSMLPRAGLKGVGRGGGLGSGAFRLRVRKTTPSTWSGYATEDGRHLWARAVQERALAP